MVRSLLLGGVLCASLVGLTASAQAAVGVTVSGGVVRIVDDPGSAANVTVGVAQATSVGKPTTLIVNVSPAVAGAGCMNYLGTPESAYCDVPVGTPVDAAFGDGDDVIMGYGTFRTLDMGPGNDRVETGVAASTVLLGDGDDAIDLGRSPGDSRTINCGSGQDTVSGEEDYFPYTYTDDCPPDVRVGGTSFDLDGAAPSAVIRLRARNASHGPVSLRLGTTTLGRLADVKLTAGEQDVRIPLTAKAVATLRARPLEPGGIAAELSATLISTGGDSASITTPAYIVRAVDLIGTSLLGKRVGVRVVSGTVTIRFRGKKPQAAASGQSIPLGTEIDTRKGRIEIVAKAGAGRPDMKGQFYDGVFIVGQVIKRRVATTYLRLSEPLIGCEASASAARANKRRLWGDAKGRFETRGRYSAATVRGTRWLVTDTCTTTTTRVAQGSVTVNDQVARKTVAVRQGRSYIARRR